MAIFDNIVNTSDNFKGYKGNPPTNEEEYNALDCWTDSSVAPTWLDIKSSIEIETIRRNRKAEYDKLNQFEMQFDDQLNGTTTWVDKINEIKGRHPK